MASFAHEDGCPVCLAEPIVDPCTTKCGHTFCAACLRRAFHGVDRGRGPLHRGACPLCRARVSLFSTVDTQTQQPLSTPEVASIFGSVYLQSGSLGIASYHFDSLDDVYISYENAPPEWRLSDGSSPPVRKPVEGCSYDTATRTFRGTVNWAGATFGGDAKWEYRMVFADDFTVIVDGECIGFGADREQTRISKYLQQLFYWRQRAPPTVLAGCIFVQGGRLGLASYHFPTISALAAAPEAAAEEAASTATTSTLPPSTSTLNSDENADAIDAHVSSPSEPSPISAIAGVPTRVGVEVDVEEGPYISYETAGHWQLDNGQSPPPKKPFVDPSYDPLMRTFRGTIDWVDIPFGGDTRWEYTMVFAADFSTISGGFCRCFAPSSSVDGDESEEVSREIAFGSELIYELYNTSDREGRLQVQYYLEQMQQETPS